MIESHAALPLLLVAAVLAPAALALGALTLASWALDRVLGTHAARSGARSTCAPEHDRQVRGEASRGGAPRVGRTGEGRA